MWFSQKYVGGGCCVVFLDIDRLAIVLFQTKVIECCLLGYFTGGGRRVVGILAFDIIVSGGDIVLLLFTGHSVEYLE